MKSTTYPRQVQAIKKRVIRIGAANLLGWLARAGLYILVSCLSLLFLLPLLWMVSTSLKTDPQVYHVPPIWIPNPVRWQNYLEALSFVPFGLYIYNTVVRYTIPSLIGVLISNTLVAYGFSRIQWRGRDKLFFLCISTMMIPFQVVMIPLYITFKTLGWLDTYLPLVVPTFFGGPYNIFLLRQFFLTIPQELSDAARIDGCSELGILFRIILPLSKPVLAVIALFHSMWTWNDYLGPLIYISREADFPIAMGLELFKGEYAEKLMWPRLMAGSTIVVLPVLILFFLTQRTFIEGITLTGVKG